MNQFYSISSFFNKINPVTKLIVFVLLVLLEIYPSPEILLKSVIMFFLVLACVFLFSGKALSIIKYTLRIYPMIFILTILFPFSGGGEVVLNLGWLKVFSPGLEKFLISNLMMITIIMYSNLFIQTTPILEMLSWLQKVGINKKLLAVLFLVNRFLVRIKNDVMRKIIAFKSRYLSLSIKDKLNYYSKLFVSIFIDMFGIIEKIVHVLISRNFKGEIPTRNMQSWSNFDSAVLLISFLFMIVFLWI